MTGEFALLALTVAAWFIFFTTFLWFTKRDFLDWFQVKSLDRKVMLAVERNESSRVWGQKLQKMLSVMPFRSGEKLFSVFFFLLGSLLTGLLMAVTAAVILRNPLVMLLLFLVGVSLPYQLLEVAYHRWRKKLRGQAASFLLTVGNLFGVYGDPMVALEEAIPRLKEPLCGQVRWFITAYKGGLSLPVCVATIKSRLPDPILRQFWDDLVFFAERGGDFQECIMEHVHQVYQREINLTQGSTDSSSTLTVFFVLLAVYIAVLVTLTRSQPELMGFLVTDSRGKMAVALMAIIFLTAGYFLKLMVMERGNE
ncbi:MAG: type II secretion system F family protein [Bacillota bacterium]